MGFGKLVGVYQFFWMLESHRQQRLAWEDAASARIARGRAEAESRAQLQQMLAAHPSGALGDARINDDEILQQAGLL